ncbi:MAG: type II/IV secretion system ATPase subunit [Candidatus Thermoplasmatota archaeon]|nr:type II/IV secretion system ATPase subunit [Candidatus Thermoplasmatota archaeon]
MKEENKDIRKKESSSLDTRDNFLNISKKIDLILSDKLNFQDDSEIKSPKEFTDFSIPSFPDKKVSIPDLENNKIKRKKNIFPKNIFKDKLWQNKFKTVASIKGFDKFRNKKFNKNNVKEKFKSIIGENKFLSNRKKLNKEKNQVLSSKDKSKEEKYLSPTLETNGEIEKLKDDDKNKTTVKDEKIQTTAKAVPAINLKNKLFNKNKTKKLTTLEKKKTKKERSNLNGKIGKISKNFKTISSAKAGLIQIIDKNGKESNLKEPDAISFDFDLLKTKKLEEMGLNNLESFEELDTYPLLEPYCRVSVIHGKDYPDRVYLLLEVELSEEETRNLLFIKETLSVFNLDTDECETKGNDKYLLEKINQIIDDYSLEIAPVSKQKIIYYLEKELLGLGKLEPLMNDPNIEDISCDGSEVPIFLYHRKYGSLKSNLKFENEDELSAFVVRLSQKCGKHISIANPMLDATMPDGSRIQMTLSDEVTTKGSTFTIRKFRESPFSPADLIEFNTMSSEMVAYIWIAVENNINALFAGGTASGKTSALNAIALFIPSDSKIVSIEETREINLPHPNWIPGVARSGFGEVIGDKVVGEIDLYDLMKAALRQRPEYIIVGEIRGKEAYVLFQAMATGHTTYSTVHADSAKSLIHRLEGRPINIPRIMLQSLDIICIQTTARVRDKRARRCRQIIEIIDIDPATKEILTNEVFRWDPVEDKFFYSGKSYVLERIRTKKDMSREEITKELRNRAKLLEWMKENNIKDFKEVASLTAKYVENPQEVMKKIGGEK